MLKIKDSVDLKELEKFGFYQSNEMFNCWNYEIQVVEPKENNDFSNDGFAMLEVREFDFDGNKTKKELSLFTTTDDEVWWNIDIIYDLIQARLVEKVEEE